MEGKTLVAYYSHSANTQKLARLIAQKTDGRLFEIQPEKAYPTAYGTVVDQAKKEIQAGYRPPLKTIIENIEAYDTIFVGTPNWWSTLAPPVATLLETCDVAGKTVVPFCTHGGGGFGRIERDIARLCPKSTVLPGLAIYGGSSRDADVSAWLRKIGIL